MPVLRTLPKKPLIGYGLQIRKVGDRASTRAGQPILSVNEVGHYRLLVTIGGLCVAMIFTRPRTAA